MNDHLVGVPEVRRVYLEDFRGRPLKGVGIGLVQLIAGEPENSLAQATQLLQQAQTASWTDWLPAQLADFVETIWSINYRRSAARRFRPCWD